MKSQFFVPKNDLFPFLSSSSFFKFKQFEQFGSTGDALPPLHLSRRLVLPIMFCVFCPTMAAKTRPLRSMSSMNFTRRQFDLAEEGGRMNETRDFSHVWRTRPLPTSSSFLSLLRAAPPPPSHIIHPLPQPQPAALRICHANNEALNHVASRLDVDRLRRTDGQAKCNGGGGGCRCFGRQAGRQASRSDQQSGPPPKGIFLGSKQSERTRTDGE